MNDLPEILRLVNEMGGEDIAAMATVVDLQGSAYRHPGARMLVTSVGRSAGMISGGCLESDVREHASSVLSKGKPLLLTYDSTTSEDIAFGMGLGCNGIVRILIEPLFPGNRLGLLSFLKDCISVSKPGRLATIFQSEAVFPEISPGSRIQQWPDGRITANFENADVKELLFDSPYFTSGKRAVVRDVALPSGGSLRVLFETVTAPIPLVIFGGGEDAIPLVRFAKPLGRHITVIDSRPGYALTERFPEADAVLCRRPDTLTASLFSNRPQVVIMTHHYNQDKEVLRALIPFAPGYIGILGPKERTGRLLAELASDGMVFSEQTLAALHSPAGLDIGAETPAQIALSILSEMQASITGHAGGSLCRREGGIHEIKT